MTEAPAAMLTMAPLPGAPARVMVVAPLPPFPAPVTVRLLAMVRGPSAKVAAHSDRLSPPRTVGDASAPVRLGKSARPVGQTCQFFESRTAVVAEDELLAALGSTSSPAMEAVFTMVPGLVGVTTTLKVAVEVVASGPTAHMTVPFAWLQGPVPLAALNVTPEGSGSVTVAPATGSGPPLATLIW